MTGKKMFERGYYSMSLDTTTDATISPLFPATEQTSVATHTIYLALGSNVGDRRGNLAAALQQLREIMDISVVSSVYETEPIGYLNQPRFLNITCGGKTALSPQEFLIQAKAIERSLGRRPSFRNGPRPIDIDILLYDNLHIEENELTIPHPRMRERAFVLVPLAEIAADVVEPVSKRTTQELLHGVLQDGVKKVAPNLGIPFEHDIQSSIPKVHVRLGRAGVVGVRKSLLIGTGEQQRWFDASFDLYADLNPRQAGVHMSRFSDALEDVIEATATHAWPRIELVAEYLAQTIVEKQKVTRAEVTIRTTLPLQKWTPVSGRPTQEVYGLIAQSVATRESCRRLIGVEVEGMVACPCAQDMVHSFARIRLQEEGMDADTVERVLAVTPMATHNQRGRATLMLGTGKSIDAKELVALVE